jgi:hypothetical protein
VAGAARRVRLDPNLTTLVLAHLPMHKPEYAHASVCAAVARALDANAGAVVVVSCVEDEKTTTAAQQHAMVGFGWCMCMGTAVRMMRTSVHMPCA